MMKAQKRDLKNVSRRLPEVTLPSLRGGTPVPIRRRGRTAPILLLVHGPSCAACRQYLRNVAEQHSEILEWDGRALGITTERPPEGSGAAEVEIPFDLLVDAEQRLGSRLKIQPPAVVVADQWGEIHLAEEAGPDHRFPSPEELVEWVRFLAIQCPECEGESL